MGCEGRERHRTPCPGTSLKAALSSHAKLQSLPLPRAECVGMAQVCPGRWPVRGQLHWRRSASSSALHHQRLNAAEHPLLRRVPTASLPPHLSAVIRALLQRHRHNPTAPPSSAEPVGSRGSLSCLASPPWTDFRARSRQPTLSRASLMSRELLNHFPSRGMSFSTAPELMSAQGHGPSSISAGSVRDSPAAQTGSRLQTVEQWCFC